MRLGETGLAHVDFFRGVGLRFRISPATLTGIPSLQGAASAGGSASGGALFAMSPGGKEKTLHDFGASPDGSASSAPPISVGAYFYGTIRAGANTGWYRLFFRPVASKISPARLTG